MKTNNLKAASIFLVLAFSSSDAWANQGVVLGFDVTSGGDTVAEFTDNTDQDLGDGVGFHIGYEFLLDEERNIFLQGTIGYSFDDPNIENGKSDLSRTPVHILILTNIDKHQIGAGLVLHRNPEVNQRIDGLGTFDAEFDDATGFAIQYGYQFSDGLVFGGRYVDIEYEWEFDPFDASNFGFFVAWKI